MSDWKDNRPEEGENLEEETLDFEQLDKITLTLEDDSTMECGILGIFESEGIDYIALVNENNEIYLFRYIESEEGSDEENGEVELKPIESDEEYDRAFDAFEELFFADADEIEEE